MKRLWLWLEPLLLLAVTLPANADPAPVGAASAGVSFTNGAFQYVIQFDVERGFTTALPGEVTLVKQIQRCPLNTAPYGCERIAQDSRPLSDGETFTLNSDRTAQLQAKWLGKPLVITWHIRGTLGPQTAGTSFYGHGNWSQTFGQATFEFIHADAMMLASRKACVRTSGIVHTSSVAAAERSAFATDGLPSSDTVREIKAWAGRCTK